MVQYGRPSRSSWAKSVWSSFGRTVVEKAIWENPFEIRLGEVFQLGMLTRTPWKKGLFLSVYVDDIKLAGKKQKNIDPVWKVLNKEVDVGEPTSFLDHVYLGCTQRQCEISKILLTITEPCLNPVFPHEQLKNYHARKIWVFLRGSYDMEGHAKKCVERYCELANKTTQQLCKVSTPWSMTTTSKKKKWNLLENCHKYALKLF